MEKAALLIGGVALVAYAYSDNQQQHKPGSVMVLPPPIHDESPGLEHLQSAQRRLLPNDFEHEEPGLKHLKAPQRRLLPGVPDRENGIPLRLRAPPRHVLPPPIHSESPGLEHLQAANRRLLPFHGDPLELKPPPRRLLPPPVSNDPLHLIPLAPKKLLPRMTKPLKTVPVPVHCQLWWVDANSKEIAIQNLPQYTTNIACANAKVPCPAGATECSTVWS